MLSASQILEILNQYEAGFKSPTDPFFHPVNEQLVPKFVPQGIISVNSDDNDTDEVSKSDEIFCNVPGCDRFFQSIATYQSHYNSLHRFICSQCKKSLPTSHLLDLHISETHDNFFMVQSQRQPMYQCFIEECKHKSATPKERKDHCISVHKFPSNYRFDNYSQHIKKSSDSSTSDGPSMAAKSQDEEKTLPKIKTEFSFGHQKTKTFKRKSNHEKGKISNVLENSTVFTDLLESLPSKD